MHKLLLVLSVLIGFSSCTEKKSDKNLHISGTIKGLKKGILYIQKIKDTSFVILDTIKIDGNSSFTSDLKIDSPEMMYLYLDRGVSKSIDNNLAFFAEPGIITINSTLEFFNADAKITGSKNQELYDEYKTVVSRYIDQDLKLITKRFDAFKAKNGDEMVKIQEEQNDILKRKYLYTTNFAVNHADYEIAPYLAVAEINDINLKYLDTIDKSMTDKVAKSRYGKNLKLLISVRKKNEK